MIQIDYAHIDLAQLVHKPLPRSWMKAAGMLRAQARAIQKHVVAARREWA